MHLLKIPDNISEPVPVSGGNSLKAGKTYLCSNAFVGQMLLTRWRVIIDGEMYPLRSLIEATAAPWVNKQPFNPNCEIWLIRGGGWGDLLMLTPLIRELKTKWPDIKIHVVCGKEHRSLFYGMGVSTSIVPIPWGESGPIAEDPGGHRVFSFEDLVESNPKSERVHMAQLFADVLGIELSSLKPMYNISPREKEAADRNFPRNGLRRVGVQFLASGLYRSYPKVQGVITELAKNSEVLVFGTPGQMKFTQKIKNVVNLMEHKLTFRQSAAVLSTCDACVAPDSSLVHLCSALDIPCVALFGPFPSELRVSSEKCVPIDGKAKCSPCFFHATHAMEFPSGMPCSEKSRCVALEDIPVDKVVKTALELATPASSIIVPVDFTR